MGFCGALKIFPGWLQEDITFYPKDFLDPTNATSKLIVLSIWKHVNVGRVVDVEIFLQNGTPFQRWIENLYTPVLVQCKEMCMLYNIHQYFLTSGSSFYLPGFLLQIIFSLNS